MKFFKSILEICKCSILNVYTIICSSAIIFLVIIIIALNIQINIMYKELLSKHNKLNDTTVKMKIMNTKLLIISQKIGDWNINTRVVSEDNFVTSEDERYYKWIKINNSYSNPLTENQIWDIIITLKSCKNNPQLLLALAKVESSFNHEAISNAGCIGMMQINPMHAKKYKFKIEDLLYPTISIKIADKLITDWKKQSSYELTIQDICEKYLGCNSKKYNKKIIKALCDLKA